MLAYKNNPSNALLVEIKDKYDASISLVEYIKEIYGGLGQENHGHDFHEDHLDD
jgi:hypothetical protein